MTGAKNRTKRSLVAILLLLGALAASGPVRADTEKELEAAKARLAELEAEAAQATAAYEEAHERLIVTRERIAETQDALEGAEGRIGRLQKQLDRRAHAAYQLGTMSTVDLLLGADSLGEFSDRIVYLDTLAQDDADLVTRLNVLSEQFRRQREELEGLEAERQEAADETKAQADVVYARLQEAQDLRARLAEQLEEEEAAAAAAAAAAAEARAAQAAQVARAPAAPTNTGSGSIPANGSGALEACPAPGTSFTDTFGAPRSGGRSHMGVDMMGNYGQPIYAAQSGSVSHSSSSLGGNQAYVHAPNGDYTFYAHLQGYSNASGRVSAGTLIGYIGDTGNATGTPHLHFEYHPGGGGAVNPTPYVAAVC